MIRKKLQIINKLGLHARAAAKFVQTANQFSSHIEIAKSGRFANGKSIMGVMMLAASKSTWVDIMIHGKDETQAMVKLQTLIENRFGEQV